MGTTGDQTEPQRGCEAPSKLTTAGGAKIATDNPNFKF